MKYIVMSTGKSKELYKTYLEGHSSLDEEQKLRSGTVELDKGDQLWFDYQKNKLLEAPANLTGRIEQRLNSRRHSIRNTLRVAYPAVAGLALLVSIWFYSAGKSREMSYADKLIALTEARMLLANQEETESEEIIYEDESIIIFIK